MKQREMREEKDIREGGVFGGFCAWNAFELTCSSCGRVEVEPWNVTRSVRVSGSARRERETQKVTGRERKER
jgi:hypothetical protein